MGEYRGYRQGQTVCDGAGHGGRMDKKRYSKRIRNANSYSSKGRPLEIWIDNIEADL